MIGIIFGVKRAIDNSWTRTSEAEPMRYPASQTAEKHERISGRLRGCFASAVSMELVSPTS